LAADGVCGTFQPRPSVVVSHPAVLGGAGDRANSPRRERGSAKILIGRLVEIDVVLTLESGRISTATRQRDRQGDV
jgi:hypothetical protein